MRWEGPLSAAAGLLANRRSAAGVGLLLLLEPAVTRLAARRTWRQSHRQHTIRRHRAGCTVKLHWGYTVAYLERQAGTHKRAQGSAHAEEPSTWPTNMCSTPRFRSVEFWVWASVSGARQLTGAVSVDASA
jgi:hypothetical protein